MSNKQVFTANDVYGFKRALALWSAKNNALIEKYESLLIQANSDEDELYSLTPTPTRDSCLSSIALKKTYLRMILCDLRTPCDLFISKFEECSL